MRHSVQWSAPVAASCQLARSFRRGLLDGTTAPLSASDAALRLSSPLLMPFPNRLPSTVIRKSEIGIPNFEISSTRLRLAAKQISFRKIDIR
jgi:hypothetical protein